LLLCYNLLFPICQRTFVKIQNLKVKIQKCILPFFFLLFTCADVLDLNQMINHYFNHTIYKNCFLVIQKSKCKIQNRFFTFYFLLFQILGDEINSLPTEIPNTF